MPPNKKKGDTKLKKITLTFKTPVPVLKDGKPDIEYKTETEIALVASTKSENNYCETVTASGRIIAKKETTEMFLDRKETETALAEMVEKSTKITDKEDKARVLQYLIKAFDGLCVYYNHITRKK